MRLEWFRFRGLPALMVRDRTGTYTVCKGSSGMKTHTHAVLGGYRVGEGGREIWVNQELLSGEDCRSPN